jgi:Uma2 family endonuclease
MSSLPKQTYTPEEYLALERKAGYKSEYLDGQITAMTGASRAHNIINTNLVRILGTELADEPCELYAADMRVRVGYHHSYVYPDVVIACGSPTFEDVELDTLINPTIIIEVLSPSTEIYDRGSKSARYRQIDSLQEYLLVAQDRPAIEHYFRRDNEWSIADIQGLDGQVELPSINCTVFLSDIYQKVNLPDQQDKA